MADHDNSRASPQAFIETHSLGRMYRRGSEDVHALRDLSVSIPRGALAVVYGPSGSGKSTLLNLLGGIDRLTAGSLAVDGQALETLTENQLDTFRRHRVGFVFQFNNLLPNLNAQENVALSLISQGRSWRAAGEEARVQLDGLGLGHRRAHRPAELSGGEQQRVALARAVVGRPALVLADEPTGDLDADTAETVFNLICQLNRDLGVTFVVATHNPRLRALASQVIELAGGQATAGNGAVMIRVVVRDLQHSPFTAAFSLISLGILIFAFLLLVSLSATVSDFGAQAGLDQNLIVLEHAALQPEESRIPADLGRQVAGILGDRAARIDPVIFRIMRVEDHVIQLRGVEPDSWVPSFHLELISGRWPASEDEIVIGQLATQGTRWGVGSPIDIYGRVFTVSGIVQGAGTQSLTAWMAYQTADRLFGPGKGAQLLMTSLQPGVDPVLARQDLQDRLAPGGVYDVYFEDALVRQIGSALNDLRALAIVTAAIGVVAVTLGAHNLAWLAAEERRRLLGILRALGFGRRSVAAYLLLRAGLITVAAYALALSAARLFFGLGLAGGGLAIGGTRTDLHLSPGMVALGLLLCVLSVLAGTWLSSHKILATPPAELLGRGPGESPA